ncbi:MAG: hypothetical protein AB8B56_22015 [Crocinitomicaceae bacterium]
MNKSIENIWKEGFAKEELAIPKINALYNQKSIGVVDKIINRFKKELVLLFPIAVFIFVFNILLDNDNAVLWGVIGAIPCLFWFVLGKRQLKSIMYIDYKANSYEYLVSIRQKLHNIKRFNKKLAISSVPVTLFPMIVYTYYNQRGKTIGEIFGVDGLDWSTGYIFLILPIFTLIAMIIGHFLFERIASKQVSGIDSLIQEMEELRS